MGVAAYGHSYNVPTGALANDRIVTTASYVSPTPFGEDETADNTASKDQCGIVEGPSGVFNFEGLITAGFLDESGLAMPNIIYQMDNCSLTPYVYNPTSQIMVSYDDATSFATKGNFINDKSLKGFAMWDATGDYNDILLDSISDAMGIDSVCD
ncbi:hypothetical protein C0991_005769 [Blastosporella zonata]|nr:hypothetical protein C0991_005769 [Blastosporella zonata]